MLHSKQTIAREDRIRTLIALALATVLAACSPPAADEQGQPDDASVDLAGTEWVLTTLHGESLIENTNITLDFDGERAAGFAGCNGYGAECTATADGTLTVAIMEITLELCQEPEGIIQQEEAYTEALRNAAAYRVVDDHLEIEDAAGVTTLVFARKEAFQMDPSDLVGTGWRLVSLDGSSPIESSTITLVFRDESQVSGVAGCRGYVGNYEASGDDIGFVWFAMTGPACLEENALMEQEGQYTTVLGWATNYRLDEGRLKILTERGETLLFEPLPEDADASLEGTTWTLTAFIEERSVEGMAMPQLMPTDPLAKTEMTVTFEDGSASGSAGCNRYHTTYTDDGSSFTFGPIAVTRMACLDPSGVMEQEQRYVDHLGDVTAYSIDSSQLWLETGDGRALVFAARE